MATMLPSETAMPEETDAPSLPTHSPDGVDLTLIRWMLSLTPRERLQVVQQRATAILRMRHANPKL